MSYNNDDGLRVITGLDQGAAVDAGTTTKSEVKTLVIDIADATELGSSAATPAANDPFIPAVMTGAADAYIKANYGTAAFTAGAAKLVITYIET